MGRIRPIYDWAEVPVTFGVDYAARILGFGQQTIKRMVYRGELPAHKVCNEWRFIKEEFISFVKSA